MKPTLTDQAVSDLPLSAARAELLEEIMSTPVIEGRDTERADRPVRRWLAPLAAAAAVATLIAVPTWLLGGGDDARTRPAETGPAAAPAAEVTHEWVLLEAPGWEITYVSDSHGEKEVRWEKGGAALDVHLRGAKDRASYVEDRQLIDYPDKDPGTPVTLLGEDALMWPYSADDHTTIGAVDGKVYPEVRGSGMDRDAYLVLLGQLSWTDQARFEAALPESFVRDAERADSITEMLEGMALAPGAETPTSRESDPYQLGADVAGAVVCGWIAEFERAAAAGDRKAAELAQATLATTHDWQVLHEMNERGDYPEVVWEYADEVAAGRVPEGYRGGLGCP